MNKFKPINIVFEQGITSAQAECVLSGVQEMLQLAEVSNRVHIRNFGVWRQPDYNEGGVLQAYMSIDWYAAMGRHYSERADQLDLAVMMHYLENEPWQEAEPHYDVAIFNQDLYYPGTNFVIGVGRAGFGTALSAFRFQQLNILRNECLKTATMHELGHVFGLIPDHRTRCTEESLGKHCTNKCLMRQGLRVTDWVGLTQDRLEGPPLCALCNQDLKNFFWS